MKKLNKYQKKWLKALRSGKYKRGTNYLTGVDTKGKLRHCCLGVACRIFPKIVECTGIDEFNNCYYGVNRRDTILPEELQELLGVDDMGAFNTKIRKGGNYTFTLAGLNDSNKFSFKQIADIIEKKILSDDFKKPTNLQT